MSDLLLEMKGLTIRSSERYLVKDVNFQVYAGKVTAIVGHSGSGKSLSARAAMGILDVEPGLTGGELRYPGLHADRDWFSGVRGAGMAAQRRLAKESAVVRGGYITYSPQSASSALNPGRTIGHQLEKAIARRRTAPADLSAAIIEVLQEVGLPPRAAFALPGELSGGMAQRAALAIAIAPQPKVMIADEPETGLDPVLRRVVTELMLEVARTHQVGLLLITHNMDTVGRVADETIRIGSEV